MLEEAPLEKLSAYADGELEEAEAQRVEAALACGPALRRWLEHFRTLDAQAAALPDPALDPETGRALWDVVAERTAGASDREAETAPDMRVARRLEEAAGALPPAPVPSEERWGEVWGRVRERAACAEAAAPSKPARPLPLEADLTPVNLSTVDETASARRKTYAFLHKRRSRPLFRMTALALASAALLMLAVSAVFFHHDAGEKRLAPPAVRTARPEEDDNWSEAPEALDEHYLVMVKYVPGVEAPVVCFVLKD